MVPKLLWGRLRAGSPHADPVGAHAVDAGAAEGPRPTRTSVFCWRTQGTVILNNGSSKGHDVFPKCGNLCPHLIWP